MTISIQTKRLHLRNIQPSDVPSLIELWQNPDVTRYMGGPREHDMLVKAFQDELSAEQFEPFDLWPVVERETGRVVGHCGLLEKTVDGQADIELTYLFHQTAWGKGYATEIGRALCSYAVEQHGLSRLIALIKPNNHASARVAEKIGFTLAQETMRDDGSVRLVYAIRPVLLPDKVI
ncbi:GNAT family N-acetyltransferase [Anaerolineales bacterium HSG24]|nr:GNAT family N-acetyltransferase [Anaerolineales bacterium HSG24]